MGLNDVVSPALLKTLQVKQEAFFFKETEGHLIEVTSKVSLSDWDSNGLLK